MSSNEATAGENAARDAEAGAGASRRRSIGFLNWAHAIDHYVLLIFPTVVIGMEAALERPYADLIRLSTAAFVAFGVFSLPAGWLADRWSRRNMMALFYLGCAAALALAGLSSGLVGLAIAMFVIGVCAAIYHPVGMAMLIDVAQARGRTLAFNGVCGNLGVALAAGISAALASWFGWRAAFLLPAAICLATGIAFVVLVPDDRHRTATRKKSAEVPLTGRAAGAMLGLYAVISLAGGLVFNTVIIALPKIVDERLGEDVPLLLVGGVATLVFLCGAVAQLAVGRLVEWFRPYLMFAAVVALQFAGIVWAAYASASMLIVALAVTMAGIYGQVTTGDIVLARYTADAWRGRIYSARYFLTFVSAGLAVEAISWLHRIGGFDLVLIAVAAVAAILLAAVLGFVVLVSSAEAQHAAMQPAE
ncbi:MAG: MFS transporter [Proteobacteria bacterium]|nr:MFS transporter [Pseudomonadota bacterium]